MSVESLRAATDDERNLLGQFRRVELCKKVDLFYVHGPVAADFRSIVRVRMELDQNVL